MLLNFFLNSEYNLQSMFNFVNKSLESMVFLGEIKIGEHFYWNLFGTNNILLLLHGQILITATLVCSIIIVFSFVANSQLKATPDGLQNASEYMNMYH